MSSHADPHAHAADHPRTHGHWNPHTHVVVSARTLTSVLVILLVFTFLTVGAAKAEQFVMYTIGFPLPGWVNVAVALSIAVVKAVLVAMFFMQLKYDNPMNSLVMIFCLMALASFLGFTMLDLGQRNSIYPFKSEYIVPGGTGIKGDGPIATLARQKAIQDGTYDPEHAAHAHKFIPPGQDDGPGSSAQRSRPLKGLTLPELGAAPPAKHAEHSEHGKPEPAPAGGH
ncbi:MAG: cytochrome C oxidase subunit IV family protein [Phycisphaerae bacterium]|nr:cytochrome C oxidase subunit IV family protein [Phycisphaerae bacterium]